jgi:hypothetical protein
MAAGRYQRQMCKMTQQKKVNKPKIRVGMRMINQCFQNEVAKYSYRYKDASQLIEAYDAVFDELCRLLNIDILFKEFKSLYRGENDVVLDNCHYYINKLWSVVKHVSSIPDGQLTQLKIKVSLLILNLHCFAIYQQY